MVPRVTQADIARRAGVHPTTVSLALRNHPSIPQKTRERLQQLAEQMGYRPDPALRALIAYRHQGNPQPSGATLAYVTHAEERWAWKNSPAHAEFFAGATARAHQLGFQLEHFWAAEPGLRDERLSDILAARGITGVVFASYWSGEVEAANFDWSRLSAVKIDFLPRRPALHNVTNDQRSIMQLAMRKTRAAGYRRIGFIAPRWWDEFVDLAWTAGFLAEQQRSDPADWIPPLIFARGRWLPATEPEWVTVDAQELRTWLDRHRPDVILSYSPFVVPAFRALGLRIPGDVAFVDTCLYEFDGRTAGVRHNCRRVGEVAIELVANQLQQHSHGIPPLQTTTLVDGTWMDGASLPVRTAIPR
jgi:LacI family transcriptional regulator